MLPFTLFHKSTILKHFKTAKWRLPVDRCLLNVFRLLPPGVPLPFPGAHHSSPSLGSLFPSLSGKLLFPAWFLLHCMCLKHRSDSMESASTMEAKITKIEWPPHSWFTLLCEWCLRSVGEQGCALYHNEMEMIPFIKERQTDCVIFFVLMALGAIKLMVRPNRPLLFENRIAKIFAHNQWPKYLRGPGKTSLCTGKWPFPETLL